LKLDLFRTRKMTEEKVIEQVYGSDWDSFNEEQKDVISKMLQWMHRNFGVTGEEVTRDRRIIAAIQLAVLDTFGITYEEIMSKSRKRELVDKRAMIYKIVRELSNSSDRTITKLFPRNRVTVAYHGFRVADTLLEVDRDFKVNYNRLRDNTIKYFNFLNDE